MRAAARILPALLAALLAGVAGAGEAQRIVRCPDGTEVPVTVLPAAGDTLLLWLPTGLGFTGREVELGRALAARGLESWFADLLAGRFLPALSSSLEKIPAEDVAAVTAAARAAGKRVVVLCGGHGCLPALRGAASATPPDGLLMIYPSLYARAPEPGADPPYAAEAARIAAPAVVLQPELSTGRWHLEGLVAELAKGGAAVHAQVLPRVRDRFYDREDASAEENALAERFGEVIESALALLRQPAIETENTR